MGDKKKLITIMFAKGLGKPVMEYLVGADEEGEISVKDALHQMGAYPVIKKNEVVYVQTAGAEPFSRAFPETMIGSLDLIVIAPIGYDEGPNDNDS
jgi:hypothetical protein